MAWLEFAVALGVFMLAHALPVRAPLRPWLVARAGERGFTLAYSALSLVLLGWLIVAAGRAPRLALWFWAPWQSHLALAAMLPACLIVALAVGRPNPFSFGGARDTRFDPARPGIVGWMRHPLPVALTIWAGAHLVANGDLAHVILFGLLGGFALLGPRLIDRRRRRAMGAAWDARRAALVPPRPGALLAEAPGRVLAGLLLYGALIALHPPVIGVDPLSWGP